ncbi:MAG: carboxypeptidase-like regulatory domain-containing protein [Acidobacteriota bacterium]
MHDSGRWMGRGALVLVLLCTGWGLPAVGDTPAEAAFGDRGLSGDARPQLDRGIVAGGSFRATITTAEEGEPIVGGVVRLWQEGVAVAIARPLDGGYALDDVEPGEYFVTASAFARRTVAYPSEPCRLLLSGLDCDFAAATAIIIVAGGTVAVAFELALAPAIEGRVTDESTGAPLAGVEVLANPVFGPRAETDAEGRYVLYGLTETGYRVSTENSAGYVDEIYDDKPCFRGETIGGQVLCPALEDADEVVVEGFDATTGIDFALVVGGVISGRVTGQSDGLPVAGALVFLSDGAGNTFHRVFADDDGRYRIDGLESGDYFLRASGGGLVSEAFGGDYYPGFSGVPPLGDAVPVALGQETADIDFALDRRGEILITALRGDTEVPFENQVIELWSPGRDRLIGLGTDSAGRVLFDNLVPGRYYMRFNPARPLDDYIAEAYPDQPCFQATCDPFAGAGIVVSPGLRSEGEFRLEVGGQILGTVRDGATGELVGGQVSLFAPDGLFLVDAGPRQGGGFRVRGVPDGEYRVIFTPFELDPYEGQLWEGQPCNGFVCDIAAGDPVVIANAGAVDDIDFVVTPGQPFDCIEDDFTHCLQGGRFRVRASWTFDATPRRGLARAEELTGDTGTFWFVDDQNVELILKVLDGCAEDSPAYWVFAAGLTNADVALEVVDSWTGRSWLRRNALEVSFVPTQDTEAFRSCDAEPPPGWRWVPRTSTAQGAIQSFAQGAGNCTPGANRLCLQGGRFAVEADWEIPNGTAGIAGAGELTSESGYFWFFDENNVELLVKVLDGCQVEPFNAFWVFSTGLTNVETTIRVTDTATGEMKEYFNPQGTAYPPRFDTGAFFDCGQ